MKGEKTSDVDIEVSDVDIRQTPFEESGSTVDRLRARSSHLLTEALLDTLAQGRTQTRDTRLRCDLVNVRHECSRLTGRGTVLAAGIIERHALWIGKRRAVDGLGYVTLQ